MPKVMARASITLLVLGFASGLVAGVPEDEVLMLTTRGAIVMPAGRLHVALSEVQAQPEMMAVLQAIGTSEVRAAMPAFNRADTFRIAPNGNVARLPDFSNLFVLRLPSGAD
jgi:hypothetical protein